MIFKRWPWTHRPWRRRCAVPRNSALFTGLGSERKVGPRMCSEAIDSAKDPLTSSQLLAACTSKADPQSNAGWQLYFHLWHHAGGITYRVYCTGTSKIGLHLHALFLRRLSALQVLWLSLTLRVQLHTRICSRYVLLHGCIYTCTNACTCRHIAYIGRSRTTRTAQYLAESPKQDKAVETASPLAEQS